MRACLDLAKLSSHLPTVRDNNIHVGDVFPSVPCLGLLHLAHDIHSIVNFAEDNVLVVQEWCWDCGYEELWAVAIWPCVLDAGCISNNHNKEFPITRRSWGHQNEVNNNRIYVHALKFPNVSKGRVPLKHSRQHHYRVLIQNRNTTYKKGYRTAIDRRPGSVCFLSKFSSANVLVP